MDTSKNNIHQNNNDYFVNDNKKYEEYNLNLFIPFKLMRNNRF